MTVVSYWQSEEAQFLTGSLRFLSAARLLTETSEWHGSGILETPVLHLLCHGVELLLKFPVLRYGRDRGAARKHGHDLSSLWKSDANTNMRTEVFRVAQERWELARKSGEWPDDNFNVDPCVAVTKAIDDLSFLHNRESNYALRYSFEGDVYAPRPRFLIDTFGEVAEICVANPCYLDGQAVRR